MAPKQLKYFTLLKKHMLRTKLVKKHVLHIKQPDLLSFAAIHPIAAPQLTKSNVCI